MSSVHDVAAFLFQFEVTRSRSEVWWLPLWHLIPHDRKEGACACRVCVVGGSEVSDSQIERFSFLQRLGIGGDPPVGGFPLVRGQTGCVIRWGSGWFEEIRDRMGWTVRKDDRTELARRADVLMDLFKRHRVTATLDALCDAPLAILDVQ